MTHPSLRAALALSLTAAALTGCDSSTDPTAEPASLRLDVEPLAGGDAFTAGAPFTAAGRAASLDAARFYMSDLTLLHEDGREIRVATAPVAVRAQTEAGAEVQHTITERYVLVRGEEGHTMADLGEVPAGRYTGVRFTLGVDGLDNRIAIEDLPEGHPLAYTEMYWSWNAGYVFLRLDGQLDVDGDGTPDPSTGTPGDPASGQWRLHVGQTANARTVTLAEPFTLEGGATQDLRLQVDFARFVEGVDYGVPANRFCMTFGCQGVVDAARANSAGAFTLHGVHHG